MSVLLCLRVGGVRTGPRAPLGLGPVGQSVSANVFRTRRERRSREQSRRWSISMCGRWRRRAHGFHRTGPALGTARTLVCGEGIGRVRIPGSPLRASAGAVVPSHWVTQPGANGALGLQAGYPRGHAHRRKQGIRAGYGFLEIREASGSHQHQAFSVSGPGVFHSSVLRRAAHVDKWAAQSSATALCAIEDARGTTNSYAAIGL